MGQIWLFYLEIYKNFSITKNNIYNKMFVFSYKNKKNENNNKVIDKQIQSII